MKRFGAALLALFATACFGFFGGPEVDTRGFTVRAEPDANDRSPVPVELVLVRSSESLEVLSAMTAREWFDRRAQLLRDRGAAFETHLWEFVPGQEIEITELPFDDREGVALLLFARYLTPEPHRIRVGTMERFTLILRRTGFTVEPAG